MDPSQHSLIFRMDHLERQLPCVVGKIMTCTCLILFTIFQAQSVYGRAGFSETVSYYIYNDSALLKWTHTGDGCDGKDQYCFHFVKKDSDNQYFKDLYGSFDEVSVPAGNSDHMMFAHREKDDKWVIYDLKAEHEVIATRSLSGANDIWLKMGRSRPIFEFDDQDGLSFQKAAEPGLSMMQLVSLFFLLYLGIVFFIRISDRH